MKIALIGGIFGMTPEYRKRFCMTPETTLERGLRELGHEVDTFGHDDLPIYSRYDVTHVHHQGRGALRAAVDRSGTPLVFTVHAFPQSNGPRDAGADELPRSHKLALQFVIRRVDGLISLSSAEQRYEQKTYSTKGALCRVIPNGIPTGTFQRKRVERSHDAPWRLLYVGQLIKNKRVDVLLRAVSKLRRPFHLKLAYQTAALEPELMQLASALGIRDRVEFLGGQTAQQLAQLYNAADLFTFPSAFEAFPSVLIEAMLCGTPIVSTGVGGIPELLGNFGRTVPPNDADALAAGIEDVIGGYESSYAQCEEMSRQVSERFSMPLMLERHLEMYRAVMALPGRRRRNARTIQPGTVPVRAFVRRWTRA